MIPTEQIETLYLSQFRMALERYRVPNAAEITSDLMNHISEASSSGKPINDALNALGTPEQLARAYAIELLIGPPKHGRITGAFRALRILSLVIAGGFLSLCIVATLGFLGLSLVAAGPALIVGGILRWMGEHPWWITGDPLSPVEIELLGILSLVLGCGALWLLWGYVRVTVRTVRKLLPVSISEALKQRYVSFRR